MAEFQNSICIIPARMGSSRFPNKPLIKLLDFPMVGHVAKRCQLEKVFAQVAVATCDKEIADFCESIGVEAVLTSDKHERASDRVQEAALALEKKYRTKFESVTMVQGDEPMTTPNMLRTAVKSLYETSAPIVNLMSRIQDTDEFRSPNCVKVVTDLKQQAIYFSREPIPSRSKVKHVPPAYKQVCVIPFQREFLDTYSSLKPTPLEEIESVDMMRVLEHGFKLQCVEIFEESYPIDVPADVKRVETALARDPLTKLYL